jgi:hypothetical protein
MIFLIRQLKGLIFDCLSITEGLIIFLFTVDSEAPASSNIRHLKGHFSQKMTKKVIFCKKSLLKLTFSDSVQSHE